MLIVSTMLSFIHVAIHSLPSIPSLFSSSPIIYMINFTPRSFISHVIHYLAYSSLSLYSFYISLSLFTHLCHTTLALSHSLSRHSTSTILYSLTQCYAHYNNTVQSLTTTAQISKSASWNVLFSLEVTEAVA